MRVCKKPGLFNALVLIMSVHIYMNVNKLQDRQIFGFERTVNHDVYIRTRKITVILTKVQVAG